MLEIFCASLYFNYLLTTDGRCISLDYMIPTPQSAPTAPAQTTPASDAGAFPDWLVFGTGAERDRYQSKATAVGLLWEGRWLTSIDGDRLRFLDCTTGDELVKLSATATLTHAAKDQAAVLNDANRTDCRIAGADRVF